LHFYFLLNNDYIIKIELTGLGIDQWTDGVYRITGRTLKGGEADACFLIDCGEEFVLIESGSNELIGREVIRTLESLGNTSKDLSHIFLTHSHPEIIGGLSYLIDKSKPVIMIHEAAKPIFEEGQKYVLEKQFPVQSTGGKLSLVWKSPLIANYKTLPKADDAKLKFFVFSKAAISPLWKREN